MVSKVSRLRQLEKRASNCNLCPAMANRVPVLGASNGPPDAEVMIIAEAPGRYGADRTGVPLSGDRSGDIFDRLLESAVWERKHLFITNAVLCNPRDTRGRNRRPSATEIRNCSDFLAGQILGKLWMVLASLPFIHWIRKRELSRSAA